MERLVAKNRRKKINTKLIKHASNISIFFKKVNPVWLDPIFIKHVEIRLLKKEFEAPMMYEKMYGKMPLKLQKKNLSKDAPTEN